MRNAFLITAVLFSLATAAAAAEQKKDLVEFLKAFDGAPIGITVPATFPQEYL